MGKRFSYPSYAKQLRRRRDIEENFVEIVDFALKEHVDLFLICGDIFDWVLPGNYERNFFAYQLNRLGDKNIRVYLIGGNHDIPKTIEETGSAIELFKYVGNVRVFSNIEDIAYDVVKIDGKDICISGKSFNPTKEFSNPLKGIKIPIKGKINILMLHASLHGLNISSSIPDIDKQHPITLENLPPKLTYLALGHFHNYFEADYRGCTIVNPGSIERLSWAEINDTKGFVFAELSPENVYKEFVKLDVRPMILDEFDMSNIGVEDDVNDRIVKYIMKKADKETLYRLLLKGRVTKEVYSKLKVANIIRSVNEHFFSVDIRRDELDILGYGRIFRGRIENPLEAFKKFVEGIISSSVDKEEVEFWERVLEEGVKYFEEVSS